MDMTPEILCENVKEAEHLASTLALYQLCKGQVREEINKWIKIFINNSKYHSCFLLIFQPPGLHTRTKINTNENNI